MKRSIWKFGFLVLVFAFLFVACNQTKPQESKSSVQNDDSSFYKVEFKHNGQAISHFEWINTVPDIILRHSTKEKLLYIRSVLTSEELGTLSLERKDLLINAESFEPLHSQLRKGMAFFENDDGEEITAIEYILDLFEEDDAIMRNMSSEHRQRLLSLLTNEDIQRLSPDQFTVLRVNNRD